MTLLVITPPNATVHEAPIINHLLDEGVMTLLLRLKDAEEADYRTLINHINPSFRDRILIDRFYSLIEEYPLQGVYVSRHRIDELQNIPLQKHHTLVIGAHNVEELQSLPFVPTYAILSPVFDSLSKQGYTANPSLSQQKEKIQSLDFPVLAMGGVTPERLDGCFEMGFSGVAILGSLWNDPAWAIDTWHDWDRPEILSVAGHDPSGGAGITSDVATALSFGVHCRTIASTLTIQSENKFDDFESIALEMVKKNIELNSKRIRLAKIGMTSSLENTLEIATTLRQQGVRFILWDPIRSATMGNSTVLEYQNLAHWYRILEEIDLVTPNREECIQAFGSADQGVLCQVAHRTNCAILLKGGHDTQSEEIATDCLFTPDGKVHSFRVTRSGHSKHGTGCMLSSAILSLMAHGNNLIASCQKAQQQLSRWVQPSARLCNYKMSHGIYPKDRVASLYPLQYITNTEDPNELLSRIEKVLQGGGKWIQIRLKNSTTDFRTLCAKKAKTLCHDAGAVLIIDDDVEAVLRSGADGVHLGKNDLSPIVARQILGKDAIIGYTCNTIQDIDRASSYGVDYIGVGPYRTTETKKVLAPILGTERLESLASYNRSLRYPIPMVAIGGIVSSDIPILTSIGIEGVAVSGAIDKAEDPTSVCRNIITLLHSKR